MAGQVPGRSLPSQGQCCWFMGYCKWYRREIWHYYAINRFLSLPLWLSQSRKSLGKRPLQIYAKLLTADVMPKPSNENSTYQLDGYTAFATQPCFKDSKAGSWLTTEWTHRITLYMPDVQCLENCQPGRRALVARPRQLGKAEGGLQLGYGSLFFWGREERAKKCN